MTNNFFSNFMKKSSDGDQDSDEVSKELNPGISTLFSEEELVEDSEASLIKSTGSSIDVDSGFYENYPGEGEHDEFEKFAREHNEVVADNNSPLWDSVEGILEDDVEDEDEEDEDEDEDKEEEDCEKCLLERCPLNEWSVDLDDWREDVDGLLDKTLPVLTEKFINMTVRLNHLETLVDKLRKMAVSSTSCCSCTSVQNDSKEGKISEEDKNNSEDKPKGQVGRPGKVPTKIQVPKVKKKKVKKIKVKKKKVKKKVVKKKVVKKSSTKLPKKKAPKPVKKKVKKVIRRSKK